MYNFEDFMNYTLVVQVKVKIFISQKGIIYIYKNARRISKIGSVIANLKHKNNKWAKLYDVI